ncbi:forkhead box protein L2 [Anopheles arabiensis]|uniref:forkhead box protein L2 n=1 Tax=Anopheles arabiensis TaxID=7173 RepID=UPI001AAD4863|nr:forkhead box protein L2 [Anopheles arabiensis]
MLNVCADLVQFDQYSLQLYNYAMVERFRSNQFFNYGNFVADTRTLSRFFKPALPPNPVDAATAAAAAAAAAAAGSALLADASKLSSQAPKPQYSYIGLIAIAILSSPEKKLVLSDIYQHILDNYSYFRSRGPGWRNSIRHNLSLNDCFIKAGRSAHGKGHYWAVHPANVEDFLKGDFRRRKAQRKVRRHMGLTSDDDIYDNSSPRQFFPAINSPPPAAGQQGVHGSQPPSAANVLPPHPVLTNPALYLGPGSTASATATGGGGGGGGVGGAGQPPTGKLSLIGDGGPVEHHLHHQHQQAAALLHHHHQQQQQQHLHQHHHQHQHHHHHHHHHHQTTAAAIIMRNTMESFSRKRQFDVESLLRPDDGADDREPYELRRPRLCSPASSSQSPSPLPAYTGQGGLVMGGPPLPPPKTSPAQTQPPHGAKTPQQ